MLSIIACVCSACRVNVCSVALGAAMAASNAAGLFSTWCSIFAAAFSAYINVSERREQRELFHKAAMECTRAFRFSSGVEGVSDRELRVTEARNLEKKAGEGMYRYASWAFMMPLMLAISTRGDLNSQPSSLLLLPDIMVILVPPLLHSLSLEAAPLDRLSLDRPLHGGHRLPHRAGVSARRGPGVWRHDPPVQEVRACSQRGDVDEHHPVPGYSCGRGMGRPRRVSAVRARGVNIRRAQAWGS